MYLRADQNVGYGLVAQVLAILNAERRDQRRAGDAAGGDQIGWRPALGPRRRRNSPAESIASVVLHAAVVAAFFVLRSSAPPPSPPIYRVQLLAAPPGERAIGVVQEQPAAPTSTPAPATPPKKSVAVKPKLAPPKAKPKQTPTVATPTETPKPVDQTKTPQPTAGGGPTGGSGSDVANMNTGGIEFPYPGYLRGIGKRDHSRTFVTRMTYTAEVQFMIRRDGSVDPESIRLVTLVGQLLVRSTGARRSRVGGEREGVWTAAARFSRRHSAGELSDSHPRSFDDGAFGALPLAAGVLGATRLRAPSRRAQDTTFRGVTINGTTIRFATSSASSCCRLPARSAIPIRAIVQRDLDFSDRFTIIPVDLRRERFGDAGPRDAGDGSPAVAQLPACSRSSRPRPSSQITPIATGLHVALHDVGSAQVVNVARVHAAVERLSRDWRMAVHRISDEIQRWVTDSAASRRRASRICAGRRSASSTATAPMRSRCRPKRTASARPGIPRDDARLQHVGAVGLPARAHRSRDRPVAYARRRAAKHQFSRRSLRRTATRSSIRARVKTVRTSSSSM